MCLHVLLNRLGTEACLKDKMVFQGKKKINILNFVIWSLVSMQSDKPLGTGRGKWLLIDRNFKYIMIFHFKFFKYLHTSFSQWPGMPYIQVCRTSRCAELHIDLLGTAHSPLLLSWCKSQLGEASEPSGEPAAPGSVMLGPGVFQISWSYILYVKRKKSGTRHQS